MNGNGWPVVGISTSDVPMWIIGLDRDPGRDADREQAGERSLALSAMVKPRQIRASVERRTRQGAGESPDRAPILAKQVVAPQRRHARLRSAKMPGSVPMPPPERSMSRIRNMSGLMALGLEVHRVPVLEAVHRIPGQPPSPAPGAATPISQHDADLAHVAAADEEDRQADGQDDDGHAEALLAQRSSRPPAP